MARWCLAVACCALVHAGCRFGFEAAPAPTVDGGTTTPDLGAVDDVGVPTDDGPAVDIGMCGNGRVDPGEECDDGVPGGSAGCDASCFFEPLGIGTNPPATLVIGQVDFTSAASDGGAGTITAGGLWLPIGAPLFANGRLYVLDSGNQRLLSWVGIPTTHGAPATGVLGRSGLGNDPPLAQTEAESAGSRARRSSTDRPWEFPSLKPTA